MTVEAGTRIELIRVDDPHTKLRPGDRGTVSLVDDLGTTHVRWDSGSTLGLVEAAGDAYRVLDPARRFELRIELGNDAMSERRHVAGALREVASDLEEARPNGRVAIRDLNGATVGSYEFVEEEER